MRIGSFAIAVILVLGTTVDQAVADPMGKDSPQSRSAQATIDSAAAAKLPFLDGLFGRFDRDRDGALSRGEAPERIRTAFPRLDADNDGRLSKRELATAFARIRRARAAAPPARLPKDLEAIEPGKLPADWPSLELQSAGGGKRITAKEIDALFSRSLAAEGIATPAAPVSDERFVRRVFLDVIGQLPAPADVREYVADPSPDKKARLIDRLLETPQYGANWARYWRDVVAYRATAGANRLRPFDGETWLAEKLNQNAGWDQIVAALLTARGLSTETPEGFFVAAHEAAPAELAGESARIFLGIQIACAQCHDHPTEAWKRDQFHQLASFFGRTTVRVRRDLGRGPRGPVVEITQHPRRREYRKPDLENPGSPGALVAPVFLSGQAIPENTTDEQRRRALAAFLTSNRNPYFAKAFVNRMWAEFVGSGFANPVDDLGAAAEIVQPELFEALAQSFAIDYDIKGLLRAILNSKAYDRAFGEPQGPYGTALALRTPARMSADQIYDALDWVLGGIEDARAAPLRRARSRRLFETTFGFDPSADPTAVEGSIPQALAMMNDPLIHQRIDANRSGTLLNKLLATEKTDRDVIRMLYLRTLARKPTSGEIDSCLDHLRQVRDRREAFEDILWCLLNTTEFLNKH